MSWPALTWAKGLTVGSSAEKAVLMALAYRHNEDLGHSYPSIASIVEFTELNRKTIIGALASLEKKGLIADTGDKMGRTKRVVVYRLMMEAKTEQFQKRNHSETVPILPGNGPDFTPKQSQNWDSEREGKTNDKQESVQPPSEEPELGLGLPPIEPKEPGPAEVAAFIESEWAKRDFLTQIRGGKLLQATAEKAVDLAKKHAVEDETALHVWAVVFQRIDDSDWLQGKVPPAEDRSPFKLSISYLMEKRNFDKVLMGRYDGKSSSTRRAGTTGTAVGRVLERIRPGREQRAAGGNPALADGR